MPIATAKISDFLRIVEGPQQTRGYIPCDTVSGGTANYRGQNAPEYYSAMGVSGVTIGTGIDLGQTTASTLCRIGVPSAIVNALVPYLGKRKGDALRALHRLPLTVSQSTADTLDHCMHAHHAALIEVRYDRDAGAGVYASLPWQAQVAIFSILFQRGTGSPKNYANTWAAFVRRDWKDAAARLCNGSLWKGYQSRRRMEGQLLQKIGA